MTCHFLRKTSLQYSATVCEHVEGYNVRQAAI